jgi:hypothetical protein
MLDRLHSIVTQNCIASFSENDRFNACENFDSLALRLKFEFIDSIVLKDDDVDIVIAMLVTS